MRSLTNDLLLDVAQLVAHPHRDRCVTPHLTLKGELAV